MRSLNTLARASPLAIASALAAALGVITLPLILRTYSDQEFSTYAASSTIQQLLGSLVGIVLTIVSIKAINASEEHERAELIQALYLAEVLGSILACIACVAMLHIFWPIISPESPDWQLILLTPLPLLFRINGVLGSIFKTNGKIKYYALILVTQSSARLAATIYIVSNRAPIAFLFLAYTITDAIIHWATRKLLPVRLTVFSGKFSVLLSVASKYRRSGGWYLLSAMADAAINNLDRIIVGAVLGQTSIGAYHVIRRYSSVVALLADPLYQVLLPHFESLAKAGRIDGISQNMKETSRLILSLGVLFLPLVYFTRDIWSPLLLGAYGSDLIRPLLLLLAIQIVGLAFIGIHPAAIAFCGARAVTIITLISNAAFVMFAFLLGTEFRIYGVISAIGVQYLITIASKSLLLRMK